MPSASPPPLPGLSRLSTRAQQRVVHGLLAAVAVGLTVASARFARELRGIIAGTGISTPIGPDAEMWGKAALSVSVGAGSSLSPLYPHLLAATAGRWALVPGTFDLNALLLTLLPGTAALSAAAAFRDPSLRIGAALAAGIGTLVHARVATHVWFLRPELLTALVLVAVAGTGLRLARSRHWGDALLFGLCCGLALTVREHGVVVAIGGLAVVPLLVGGGLWRRLAAFVGACLLVQLTTALLVEGGATTPFVFQSTLMEKVLKPLSDSMGLAVGAQGAAPDLAEMPAQAHTAAQGSGLFSVMLAQARTVSLPVQPLIAGGLGGLVALLVVGRWRPLLVLGAALAPLAAALVVWTEYRHFIVLVPSAVLAIVVGAGSLVERRLPRLGALLLVGGMAASAPWGLAWRNHEVSQEVHGLTMRARNAAEDGAAAAWIRAHAGPEDRIVGPLAVSIATGILPAGLTGRQLDQTPGIPDLTWRVWAVLDFVPDSGWTEVHDMGRTGIFRRTRPPGVSEACLYGEWYGPLLIDTIVHGFVENGVKPIAGCTDGRELGFRVAPTRPTTIGRQPPPQVGGPTPGPRPSPPAARSPQR